MLRFFVGCVLGLATMVMAQSIAPTNQQPATQRPEETAEAAWLEMMPSPTAPPLRSAAAVAPRQSAPRSVRISGGVMAGQTLTKVDPVYPPTAKTSRVEGSVVLAAKIGTGGTVQDLKPISGPEVLRGAALTAVRQWTYKPYVLNGNPVIVDTTVTVNFYLNGAAAAPATP